MDLAIADYEKVLAINSQDFHDEYHRKSAQEKLTRLGVTNNKNKDKKTEKAATPIVNEELDYNKDERSGYDKGSDNSFFGKIKKWFK